ncbi:helix-turn-helix transcriptional regulator [Bacillus sp. NEB1478]|uniref:helix-turn-helix domain-containing protein n=1 Tax=Bacillus sp. NEB1478 TaxID=3073816 RepID=UPI002872F910|nr:helix-turn-helix transcriptional regulator [Bacillus sp. NEB1478]WNB92472.1 helix-turn-helix transcriptional regulator [Bacillus sp. NEB1478]
MIGKNIYELRKRKGITLTELADRSKVSKSYLSNIERRLNKNPSIQVVEKIALVLDVEVKALLSNKLDSEHMEVEKEWVEFVVELKSLGINKEIIHEYRELIEFIKWKKSEAGNQE